MKNFDEKIEPYILGELPENESKGLEQAMQEDPLLAKSVADHRLIMERLEALRLRKKVKQALAKSSNRVSGPLPVMRERVVWAIAATLVLLVSALWFFNQKADPEAPKMADKPAVPTEITQPPVNPPVEKTVDQVEIPSKIEDAPAPKNTENRRRLLALAEQFHENPSGSSIREAVEMADSSSSRTIKQTALEAFEQRQFAYCARLLRPDSLVAGDDLTRNIRANARFQIGQYISAASDFKQLQKSFQFKHDARWNFLLCQLALGNMSAVRPLLAAMLADPDFPYHKNAVELSRML